MAPGSPAAPPADSTSAAWLLMSWYSWMNWYRFMMRDASIVPVSLLIWREGERWRDGARTGAPRACTCVCVWSHLGAEDPDGHLPQGRGVGPRLHLEQQVLLLPDGELGRAEAEEPRGLIRRSPPDAQQHSHVVQLGHACQELLVVEVSAVSHQSDVFHQLLRQTVHHRLT